MRFCQDSPCTVSGRGIPVQVLPAVLVFGVLVSDIQYCYLYFYIYPYPQLLSLVCTVKHNIHAPVTSATLLKWNKNSCWFKFIFIPSHEIEHSFTNEAQRLTYQKPRRNTRRCPRETRSVPHCSKGTLPFSQTSHPLHLITPLQLSIFLFFSI